MIVGENGYGKSHVLKALYSLLKVQSEKLPGKAELERSYANKLVAVFRPEKLGRLAKRKQGRERCRIELAFQERQYDSAIEFATNAQSQVKLDKTPQFVLDQAPIFIPTRELMTLCPWFIPLYDNYHLEFEETWRDTVSLLGNPTIRGVKEKEVSHILDSLENAMGGKVIVDSNTGRFYLQIPGEGRMEMPLVAEGLRKIAMLARLTGTGALLKRGYLFWDEPETNLNPKLIKVLAECIVDIAKSGVQVFIATHSLFLMRELEMLLEEGKYGGVSKKWFAVGRSDDEVRLEQSEEINEINLIVALDEEADQSERFIRQGWQDE